MSVPHRYRAPTEEGVLSEPPEAEIANLLRSNRAILDNGTVAIDGTPLGEFRREAAADILDTARRYMHECGEPVPDFPNGPLLMSGHQPELTHVGVLVKTFALHGMALRHGMTPLNLIVDNDTAKNTSLRFAQIPEVMKPEDVHLVSLPYDHFEGEVTFEQRPILDPALFRSFAERAHPYTRTWGFEPLLPEFWDEMKRQHARTPIMGEIISATRRSWERRWDCRNLEIPLSRMCETKSFRRFARHIQNDLPRFHAIYNESVAAYRLRNRVRSRNHPVPDLARDGEVREAPFWTLKPGEERRSRWMVKPGDTAEPRALRSRALTTTMFLRCCLSDGFIHGIGGAKYDEVTDDILQRWLGIQPPKFIVLTATLRLPLPTFPATVHELHKAEHILRDLSWNPQRWIPDFSRNLPEIQRLLLEKERLIRSKPAGKATRKDWFRKHVSATERLRPFVNERTELAKKELERVQIQEKANEALIRRDFAWCLFPEELLKRFCQKLL
ncbi:MAG: hypothetical protein K8T89_23115 [Planctomycetes bacterium]|nr:hypothetical protein [Planctomycetota bacterium]